MMYSMKSSSFEESNVSRRQRARFRRQDKNRGQDSGCFATVLPETGLRSGLSSFCPKRSWVIVLTTWARLRFTKGSNDARPDRRTTSFGYCIGIQKGAAGCHYGGG